MSRFNSWFRYVEKSEIKPLVLQGMSLRELADHFGYSSTVPVRRWLKKYELSVARASKGMKYPPEMLRAAASQATSVTGVLQLIGASPTSRLYIGKRLRQLNIDISHFTRSRVVPVNCRPVDEILVVLSEDTSRSSRSVLHRAMLESEVVYECKNCGNLGEWLCKPLLLEIDHVDGNWRNNRLENLRYLCPNCHGQTSTHRNQKRL